MKYIKSNTVSNNILIRFFSRVEKSQKQIFTKSILDKKKKINMYLIVIIFKRYTYVKLWFFTKHLCWLYFMTKSVVIALIYFFVFCWILLYWVQYLIGEDCSRS